jgi:hypothetical protein
LSRPALGLTQLPVVTEGSFCWVKKTWSMKLTTYFQLVPWLRMYGALHPLSYMSN